MICSYSLIIANKNKMINSHSFLMTTFKYSNWNCKSKFFFFSKAKSFWTFSKSFHEWGRKSPFGCRTTKPSNGEAIRHLRILNVAVHSVKNEDQIQIINGKTISAQKKGKCNENTTRNCSQFSYLKTNLNSVIEWPV